MQFIEILTMSALDTNTVIFTTCKTFKTNYIYYKLRYVKQSTITYY